MSLFEQKLLVGSWKDRAHRHSRGNVSTASPTTPNLRPANVVEGIVVNSEIWIVQQIATRPDDRKP
jgi:hypothetical protein